MTHTPKTRAGAGAVGPCGSAECARACRYPDFKRGCSLARGSSGHTPTRGWRTVDTGPLPESPPRAGPILPVVDPVVAAAIRDLAARSARGQAKYGTTLARTDLSEREWRRHLFEELADALLYLKRLEMEDEG